MLTSHAVSFGLRLKPHPRMVSIVRRFVEESFEKLVGDPQTVFRVSLAVHELLENATKYSNGEDADLQVEFKDREGTATILLSNQSTPEHIERLRACIETIQSSPHPLEHYQSLMRQTYGIPEESGLGLARIRAEGDLDLSLAVKGQEVTVVARSFSGKESRI